MFDSILLILYFSAYLFWECVENMNYVKTLSLVLIIMMVSLAIACKNNKNQQTKTEDPKQAEETEQKEEKIDIKGGNPMVLVKTNKGDIKVELFQDKSPITVENFISYVNDGFYNATIFHRVIPGFMIQGGGFTEDMQKKAAKQPIKNEADNGVSNKRGTLAMARTPDVDSATSQFFINVGDNDSLNHGPRDFGYAVFGKVVGGMDIVDSIVSVKTSNSGMHQNVPEEAVFIESIEILE